MSVPVRECLLHSYPKRKRDKSRDVFVGRVRLTKLRNMNTLNTHYQPGGVEHVTPNG